MASCRWKVRSPSHRREFMRTSLYVPERSVPSSSSSVTAAASSSSAAAASTTAKASVHGHRRVFANSTWLHQTVREMMKRLPDGEEEKKRGLVCVTRSSVRASGEGTRRVSWECEDASPSSSSSFIYALDNCDEIDATSFWEDELVDSVACLRRIDDNENEMSASESGSDGRIGSAKRDARTHAASAAEATTWRLFVSKRSGFGDRASGRTFREEEDDDDADDGRGNCSFIVKTTSTFCPYDETGACHKCTRFTLTPSGSEFLA